MTDRILAFIWKVCTRRHTWTRAKTKRACSGSANGYPWLIHKLTNRANLHVRGYKEHGNINTPLGLVIRNQTVRFILAVEAIDRVPQLKGGQNARQGVIEERNLSARALRLRNR